MTMPRTIKLYKLPEKPQIEGLRPLSLPDVPQVLPPPPLLKPCRRPPPRPANDL